MTAEPEVTGVGDDKIVKWECGWNGSHSVPLSLLNETATREFPGVPFGDLEVTIVDEAYVMLFKPAKFARVG